MLDYNEPRNQLKEMRTETVRAYESINPSKIKDRIKELETVQNADGFWDDPENAKKVSKEISQLQSKIEKFEKMIARIDDALDTIDIVELEGDESEDEKILTTVHDLLVACNAAQRQIRLAQRNPYTPRRSRRHGSARLVQYALQNVHSLLRAYGMDLHRTRLSRRRRSGHKIRDFQSGRRQCVRLSQSGKGRA